MCENLSVSILSDETVQLHIITDYTSEHSASIFTSKENARAFALKILEMTE